MTARQRQILDVITNHRASFGISPTVREIGLAIGVTSTSTVYGHLQNLERLGALERIPGSPRSLRPVGNMTRCSECDGPLTETGRYCPHCGVEL